MEYDEIEYWNVRVNPNGPEALTEYAVNMDRDYVRQYVQGARRALDFGPGTGRLMPAFESCLELHVVDVTEQYRPRLALRAKQSGVHMLFHFMDGIGTLPFDDDWFDVAVASNVLIHQRPRHIMLIMRELARVARKVVVQTWQEDGHPYHQVGSSVSDTYCFHYDYASICQYEGWYYDAELHPDRRQVFFVYGREKE